MKHKKAMAITAGGILLLSAAPAWAERNWGEVVTAAENGDPEAQYQVGRANERSMDDPDFPSTDVDAYICYALAARQGHQGAAQALSELKEEMTSGHIAWAESDLKEGNRCSQGCFITTAMCMHLGKADDCRELSTLRWYRDHVLSTTVQGRQDIQAYYQMAPRIVAAISTSGSQADIYPGLLSRHILPAVAAVEAGHFDQAYGIYKKMTLELEHLFL